MKRPRRNHSAAFKAKVAPAELAEHFEVHPNQITQLKNQLIARAAGDFRGEVPPPEPVGTIRALQAKNAQLAMECDFLEGALNKLEFGGEKL